MKVIDNISAMRSWSNQMRQQGSKIAFVPTMGFLHKAHLSLIREAKRRCDVVAVSIYVNPAQFAQGEDLENYPRDFDRDERLCREEGVSALFYPTDKEMYSDSHKTYVVTEGLSQILCGRTRPTHFKGVATIVAKLFNIIQPHAAVFGQKDAQQAIIIRRMVEDLNFNVEIIVSPIIREADGLAMSSRNKYLSQKQRGQANVLYRSLKLAESEFESGNHNLESIKKQMLQLIESESNAKVDYVEMADAEILRPADSQRGNILVALAVFFDKIRLIDNTTLMRKE